MHGDSELRLLVKTMDELEPLKGDISQLRAYLFLRPGFSSIFFLF